MSNDALTTKEKTDLQFFEDHIPIRGCSFSLSHIKTVYRELNDLSRNEADRVLANLVKPPEDTEEQFETFKARARREAFKLTVSIVGEDGQTSYGETEDIFESKNLPFPIATIFFTNENSFKSFNRGQSPRNFFRLWLHFDKPPLLDPNPLVSEATLNPSKVQIQAEDLVYIRAVQTIISNRLKKDKLWYGSIHEKFAYDAGFWFVALPYIFYTVTSQMDRLIPSTSPYSSYRIPFFIYFVGLSALLYRSLMGYLKWAFPVNILRDNEDKATKHRIIIGALFLALVGNLIWAVLGMTIQGALH